MIICKIYDLSTTLGFGTNVNILLIGHGHTIIYVLRYN